MKSRARTAVVLFGGATMLTLAVGFGSYGELHTGTTKPVADPTSSVTPTPPPTATAPGETTRPFQAPGGSNGCIPHVNC